MRSKLRIAKKLKNRPGQAANLRKKTKRAAVKSCPVHGESCPGDDGGFLVDGNHPDDMYAVHPVSA